MNIQKLMQQAQNAQKKMKEAQEKLQTLEFEGISGGGLIKVVMSGAGAAQKIVIDNSLMKENKDVLEDLLLIAINDAKSKVDEASNNAMNDATGGIKLPGGFGF
jgi:nucleoid-associated protein EbfC